MPNTLQKKVGPLPLWGWLAVGGIGIGYGLYRRRQNQAATTPTNTNAGDQTMGQLGPYDLGQTQGATGTLSNGAPSDFSTFNPGDTGPVDTSLAPGIDTPAVSTRASVFSHASAPPKVRDHTVIPTGPGGTYTFKEWLAYHKAIGTKLTSNPVALRNQYWSYRESHHQPVPGAATVLRHTGGNPPPRPARPVKPSSHPGHPPVLHKPPVASKPGPNKPVVKKTTPVRKKK